MKILIISLAFFATINLCASSFECVVLEKDITVEVELKTSESFDNCFSLEHIPADTPVQLTLWSADNVTTKVEVNQILTDGTTSYIGEHQTNSKGNLIFTTNTTNRHLSLWFKPLNHTSLNKNLTLSYLLLSDHAQVIAYIDNVPGSVSSEPPPTTENCFYDNGVRICEDVK